jgi:hypothetical protein
VPSVGTVRPARVAAFVVVTVLALRVFRRRRVAPADTRVPVTIAPGDRESLWREIAGYFEGDPGEMPEVHFSVVPGLAPAMFTRLHSLARRMVPGTYWDLEQERDVPIAATPNPAALVMDGRASGFVVWFEDVGYDDAVIPTLALMVREDSLAVTWDVRDDWNADRAAALVSLLGDLRALAEGAELVEAPDEPEAVGAHFLSVVEGAQSA